MSIKITKHVLNDNICSHIIVPNGSILRDIIACDDNFEKGKLMAFTEDQVDQLSADYPNWDKFSFTGIHSNSNFKPSGHYFKSVHYSGGRSIHIFLTRTEAKRQNIKGIEEENA